MKKVFLVLIVLLASTKCFADIYVYTTKSTNEVIFITEKKNVVISDEDKGKIVETVLPKDIEFYGLTEAYTDYKLKGKKFILNTAKISDREDEKVSAKDKKDKKDSDFESAKVKLIGLGLNSDEVDSLR